MFFVCVNWQWNKFPWKWKNIKKITLSSSNLSGMSKCFFFYLSINYFLFLSLAQEFFGFNRNSNDHHVFRSSLTHSLFLFMCFFFVVKKRRTTLWLRKVNQLMELWTSTIFIYFWFFFDLSLATITPCLEVQFFYWILGKETKQVEYWLKMTSTCH